MDVEVAPNAPHIPSISLTSHMCHHTHPFRASNDKVLKLYSFDKSLVLNLLVRQSPLIVLANLTRRFDLPPIAHGRIASTRLNCQ